MGPNACVDVLENRELTAPEENQTQHSSAHSLFSNHLLLPRLKRPIFIYGNVIICGSYVKLCAYSQRIFLAETFPPPFRFFV